jgi:hypothetical protein
LDDNEKQVAFSQSINMYLQAEIKAGRIDSQQLAEANGQSVAQMTPEQRGQVDKQMKQMNETAMAAEQKYGAGGAKPAPVMPEQQVAAAAPAQPATEIDDITQQSGGSNGLLA